MSVKEQRAPQLRVVESVRLDLNNQCLWRGTRRIALRPKDYAVLRCLVERAEQLVTKDALLEAVWPGIVVTEAVLKACINRLRHALSDDAKVPHYIETVHRLGYRLITPISATPRQSLASSVQSLESQEKNQKSKGKNQLRIPGTEHRAPSTCFGRPRGRVTAITQMVRQGPERRTADHFRYW